MVSATCLLLLAVFVTVEVFVAPSTWACTRCHDRATRDWKASAHPGTGCARCHQRPGTLGWVEARALELGRMYPTWARTRSVPKAVSAQVDSGVCSGCHVAGIQKRLTAKGVAMDHAACLDEISRCSDCHRGIHAAADAALKPGPEMDDCLECHDGRRAPLECETCHVGEGGDNRRRESVWRATHNESWRLTHGMGSTTSCRVCHPKGYCAKCHYDQPHPSDWPVKHGEAAAATKSIVRACKSCHLPEYCDGCHGVAMPHPVDWRPKHMKAAKGRNDPVCLRCHDVQDCSVCHQAHAHPGTATP